MQFYFSKNFTRCALGQVDYWRCTSCGFTISKTHADLSPEAWKLLNAEYHSHYQGTPSNPDDAKWPERIDAQAKVLADLVSLGALGEGRWLDYACGDGKLSRALSETGHLRINNFDRYMPANHGYLSESDLSQGGFDFAITTSVFEHFTKREDFDFFASLISPSGVLGLHTLVREEIPADPNWFYLLPVHTAFFTNSSMRSLFDQWGYKASIYNVEARLWLWFKTDVGRIEDIIRLANARTGKPEYVFKNGFVDYWK